MVGSRGFEPRSARSERAASADCATSRRLVPGGFEPPPHGLRRPGCADDFTLRRGTERSRDRTDVGHTRPQAAVTSDQRWSEWRDLNPHLAWGPQAPLPHIRPGSASGINPLIPRPNTDRWRSPAQELLSVVKDPALASWFGDSARIRTRTHEVWRLGCSRYTTLSFLSHVSTVPETEPPPALTRALCLAPDPNKKGLLGDRPRRPVSR